MALLCALPLSNIPPANGSSNTILVMTSSTRTCNLVTEFLSSMDEDAPPGTRGRKMMMRKLRSYLWWKSQLSSKKQNLQANNNPSASSASNNRGREGTSSKGRLEEEISEALKKKDQDRAQKAQSRRRVRGAPPPTAPGSSNTAELPVVPKPEPREYTLREVQGEADEFVQL